MGYDGSFKKIRMKLNTQTDVENYELKLRLDIYNLLGDKAFRKFENTAVDMPYLDQNRVQLTCLRIFIDNIKDYDIDETKFTLIGKDILAKYIVEIKKDFDKCVEKYGEDDWENKEYKEDILKLEQLYNTFDWENDTLVFYYTY